MFKLQNTAAIMDKNGVATRFGDRDAAGGNQVFDLVPTCVLTISAAQQFQRRALRVMFFTYHQVLIRSVRLD